MEEVKPVLMEKEEFENQDKSILTRTFRNFRIIKILVQGIKCTTFESPGLPPVFDWHIDWTSQACIYGQI